MISVIIPFSGKRLDLLHIQLSAISKQEVNRNVEVIVVCNRASLIQEELNEYSQNTRMKFTLVHAADKAGASFARNCGVAGSMGDFLLFCDADDIVHPGWIQALSNGLEDFDLVGGELHSFINQGKFEVAQSKTSKLPMKFNFLPFASSSNFAVRREVFLLLEGFSTRYFGAEDTDFCWRAQSRGFKLGFVDTAIIDYRLRNNFKAAFMQHFNYGKSDYQLIVEWGLKEQRTFPWKHLVKSIVLISMPFLMFSVRYRRILGTCLGYVAGHLKSAFLRLNG